MNVVKTIVAFTIILVVLVVGCSESVVTVPTGITTQKYNALQQKYDTLKINYDSLKRTTAENKDFRLKYNDLVKELQVVRAENIVLSSQVQHLTATYNAAIQALSGKNTDASVALEQLNEQLKINIEYNNTINEQVEKVMKKKVPLLSANLTSAEYTAFYKGWNLWWGTFNDMEED